MATDKLLSLVFAKTNCLGPIFFQSRLNHVLEEEVLRHGHIWQPIELTHIDYCLEIVLEYFVLLLLLFLYYYVMLLPDY